MDTEGFLCTWGPDNMAYVNYLTESPRDMGSGYSLLSVWTHRKEGMRAPPQSPLASGCTQMSTCGPMTVSPRVPREGVGGCLLGFLACNCSPTFKPLDRPGVRRAPGRVTRKLGAVTETGAGSRKHRSQAPAALQTVTRASFSYSVTWR